MSAYVIFAVVVAVCLVLMIRFLRRKARWCRWCRVPIRKVVELDEPERSEITRLIADEGMGYQAGDYELCVKCRRVFDGRWFGRDWQSQDRWCACGWQLKLPWDVTPDHLRESMSHLPANVIESLRGVYANEDLGRLLAGYQDFAYRVEHQNEEHPLLACENCHRVYMWVPLRGYKVLQCVSPQYDRYDKDPKSPVELLDAKGISIGTSFQSPH